MDPDDLVAFARSSVGDEFCFTCYKNALGLTDQKDADRATVALVATLKFTVEPGQCKKCGKTGIMLKATRRGEQPGAGER